MAGAEAAVVHVSRGRLRIKVTGPPGQVSTVLKCIEQAGDGDGSPLSATTNPRTGSALVTFDPDQLDAEAALELLRTCHTALQDLAPPAVLVVERRASTVAQQVLTSLRRADHSVYDATGGSVDLRMLVPLGLAVVSARQLLRTGPQVAKMPWYMLAYYAFDAFHKLHQNPPGRAPAVQP